MILKHVDVCKSSMCLYISCVFCGHTPLHKLTPQADVELKGVSVFNLICLGQMQLYAVHCEL